MKPRWRDYIQQIALGCFIGFAMLWIAIQLAMSLRFADGVFWLFVKSCAVLVALSLAGVAVTAPIYLVGGRYLMPPMKVLQQKWICAQCGRCTTRKGGHCHACGSKELVKG